MQRTLDRGVFKVVKIKSIITNVLFRLTRFLYRSFTPTYVVHSSANLTSPAVYIVKHQNTKGPIISIAWFNIPVRLWVLSVFCNQNTCFRQYYDYTFTKRFRIPKVLAAIITFPISFLVSGIMQGMQAIPVFRGSKDIITTFRESILALINEQSLLISPSIDYTDTSPIMGKMYKGFLDLEKYYLRKTGNHLAFIPLYINNSSHCIYVGNTICFSSEEHFKQEKENVYNRLEEEFLRMAAL